MEEEIGIVTHYFSHISVGVIKMTKGTLKTGETIHIKGATSDFSQTVDSMQVDHNKVEEAKTGDEIGMKVKEHVRQHDKVFKVN